MTKIHTIWNKAHKACIQYLSLWWMGWEEMLLNCSFIFRFKQAGCISEAQSWEKMVKSAQAEEKDSAWSKLVLLPKLSVNFIVQSLQL